MIDVQSEIAKFEEVLLSLDRMETRRMLAESNDAETPVQYLEAIIVPALEKIGRGWEEGNISLAQVYMSGRICEELVNEIIPQKNPERIMRPKMAIAVLDDYHLLGKKIVSSCLRANGFELLDYGHGMSAEKLARRVMDERTEILLISVLMLASALRVRDVRRMLNESGTRVKIAVGGAPFRFDEQLWKEVGADAMGRTVSDAVEIVNKFTRGFKESRIQGVKGGKK